MYILLYIHIYIYIKGFEAIRNVLSKYDVVFSISYLVKLQAGNDFTIYVL